MRSLIASILLLIALVVPAASFAQSEVASLPEYHGQLADIKVPSDFLGADYKGPTGIMMDDINTSATLTRPQWEMVKRDTRRWKKAGVKSVADFSYINKKKVDNITVRAIVFESAEKAAAFWTERYEYEAAPRDFRFIPNVGDKAVDSMTRHQRHVLRGNMILIASQDKEGNKHIVMLQKYLDKIASQVSA